MSGKPTVRKAQTSSGTGKAREANADSRKATGNRARQRGTSAARPHNRSDTGAMPDLKGCPRGPGESVKQTMTKTPVLTGKLDVPGIPGTNGPEGDLVDWQSIDWKTVEEDVRRLRQRIFTASRAGDLKRVRNLQKLTAPRGALSYPRRSREELEGRFLGLMANLDPKR
ncbi:MAG: reverse transcriptase N-terminal domain-containing protein [Pseudonocardiaceae bacterium]